MSLEKNISLCDHPRSPQQVLSSISQLTIVDADLADSADGSPDVRPRAAFRADVPNFGIADQSGVTPYLPLRVSLPVSSLASS